MGEGRNQQETSTTIKKIIPDNKVENMTQRNKGAGRQRQVEVLL